MDAKRIGRCVLRVVIAGVLFSEPVNGQTAHEPPAPARVDSGSNAWTPDRTPWGDPDLEGVYTNRDESSTPFERPPELAGRRLEDVTAEELAALNERRREARRDRDVNPPPGFVQSPVHWNERSINNSRAWLVVDPPDGTVPPLTPEGRARTPAGRQGSSWGGGPFNSHLDFDLGDRCITRGIPGSMLPGGNFNSYRIVQSPGYVAISYEMGHETRVIPLDGRPHVGAGIRSYMGDARGYFDGSTLVVVTRNFNGRVAYRGAGPQLMLVERFRPVTPDTVEWSVTLDDDTAWERPWTFALNLTKDATQPPFEYACHEGNYGLVHILKIARAADREAEALAAAEAVSATPAEVGEASHTGARALRTQEHGRDAFVDAVR